MKTYYKPEHILYYKLTNKGFVYVFYNELNCDEYFVCDLLNKFSILIKCQNRAHYHLTEKTLKLGYDFSKLFK